MNRGGTAAVFKYAVFQTVWLVSRLTWLKIELLFFFDIRVSCCYNAICVEGENHVWNKLTLAVLQNNKSAADSAETGEGADCEKQISFSLWLKKLIEKISRIYSFGYMFKLYGGK